MKDLSLEFSHPLREFPLSGAVALKQGRIFSTKTPDTSFRQLGAHGLMRVFSKQDRQLKEKHTRPSTVSITQILPAEWLTWVEILKNAVLRGARTTLRTAHRITSSLSDAASNFASLPALRSTEAAFCRLRTVGLFGFFFRPGKEIFPLADSTACSELHDRQARDQPEVPHVGSQHGVADFQCRCSDQQTAEGMMTPRLCCSPSILPASSAVSLV